MKNIQVIYHILNAILVVGIVWLAPRSEKLYRILLLIPIIALIPLLVVVIAFPSEVKTEFFWYWDIPSFLVKSISAVVYTGILLLGSSLLSWFVRIRWDKPIWFSIVSGIIIAIILIMPAFIISLFIACLSGDCL